VLELIYLFFHLPFILFVFTKALIVTTWKVCALRLQIGVCYIIIESDGLYYSIRARKLLIKLLIKLERRTQIMKALPKEQRYIPKCDEGLPPEEQTVFILKLVPFKKLARIEDTLYSASGTGKKREERIKTGSAQIEYLSAGIKGWENLRDENGNIVEFKGDIDQFSIIPVSIRRELVDQILGEESEE